MVNPPAGWLALTGMTNTSLGDRQPSPGDIVPKWFGWVGLCLALATQGCGGSDRPAPVVDQPIPVSTEHAGRGGVAAELVLPGRVKADHEVTLTARVAARLTSLAREGDRFAAGETLARFDAPETRDALESAAAALVAAEARRNRAALQEARVESLYAGGVVAKSDLEQAQVEGRAAESARLSAVAEQARWRSGVRVAAPFAGLVVRRLVDPGAQLEPGMPLLEVRSLAAGEILAAVPESELDALSGGRAHVQVGDGPWLSARLTRVEGMTNPESRTRVAHFAPLGATRALEAGAFARVRLRRTAPHRDAGAPWTVATSSVVRRGALTGVYVVEGARARLRWVRLGREHGGRSEVLAGIGPDDAIAVDPTPLWDGRPVRPTP